LEFAYDKQGEDPSVKYGMKLGAPVALGLVVLGALFTYILIRCSRYQEQSAVNEQQKQEQEKEEKLKGQLVCKSWSHGGAKDDIDVDEEAGYKRQNDDFTDSTLSSAMFSSSSDSDSDDLDESIGQQQQHHQKDGKECALCSEQFLPRQMICESNNPHCRHEFHKTCMDQWLKFQNTCPICNQPYALQTV
jgi:hypothetical protein